ncbi:unnamed protein product [Chrysoparadoxa australica]
MGKLAIILFFVILSQVLAFSPENYFQDDLTIRDTLSIKASAQSKSALNSKSYESYLNDPKKRVDENFKIPAKLEPRVTFWYNVYTRYHSHHSVLHDIDNLSLVYDVIDFSELSNSGLNRNTKFSLQNKAMRGVVQQYKDSFKLLGRGDCSSEKCQSILSALKKNKISIPKNKKKRSRLFKNLSDNLRTQTGQKDHILQGLHNIQGYFEAIEKLFKIFNLPHELLAISFLESSFNIHAKSKVGATGPWQFMNRIGKHFLVMSKYQDQRRSAILSTAGALHLLSQNKKIMKSWDLAVNAYNSGTGLLRNGVRKLKQRGFKDPRVEHLIDHFKHPNWGFAAKNFYSEFLALVYSLAYKKEIFDDHFNDFDGEIDVYLTKCSLPLLDLLKTITSTKKNLLNVNNHLSRRFKSFPKATVVMSDVELNPYKYYKVPLSELKRRFPKNLYKLVSNQSCSRR